VTGYFDAQPERKALEEEIDGFGAWFEIDLDALTGNLAAIRAHTGPSVEPMAVVKNNAYGHGLRPVCEALAEAGLTWVMVAKQDEAEEIRSWNRTLEVLSMDAVYTAAQYRRAVDLGITQLAYTETHISRLSAAARETGRTAGVFIKVDTGLRRVGIAHDKAADFIARAAETEGIAIRGVFSSFMQDDANDARIMERFRAVLDDLAARGIDPGYRSLAATHGLFHHPDSWLDMVRPAMALYGVCPTPAEAAVGLPLTQELAFKARVELVKPVAKGDSVTYFGRYIAPRDMRAATVHAGFYDCLPRELSNAATVTVDGTDVPGIGSVSLNHILFDATDVDVSEGDAVTLIGRSGANDLAATAKASGWMVYSLMNHLNPFVPRVYTRGGVPVAIHRARL
jgi:alanine racemase